MEEILFTVLVRLKYILPKSAQLSLTVAWAVSNVSTVVLVFVLLVVLYKLVRDVVRKGEGCGQDNA